MRDFGTDIGLVAAVPPATHSVTATGSAIDLLAFGSAVVAISTGAVTGDGDFTPTVQEADTTTPGDFTEVAAADLAGTLPATLAANTVVKASYIGTKRYLRVVLTKNSGTSVTAGALIIKSRAHERPVA